MKKKTLKLISLVLAFALLAAFSACGPSGSDSAASEAPSSAAAGKTFNIGVVQLVEHPALDAATQGFSDKLTSLMEADGNTVNIDVQNAQGESSNCAVIVNGYVSKNVDLIMANATAALQAAQTGTSTIPILGTSVTDYATALDIDNWSGTTGINVSGTSDLAPLDQQADIIKELFPDAKNVGLLYCVAEPNSKYQVDLVRGYLEDMGYTCTDFTFADSNEAASVTQSACSASDVIYIPTDNTAASCAETIRGVAEPAGVPIVAGEENLCKGCGVATLSISYYSLGEKTAEMAYDILVNGADPSTMEIQYAEAFTKEYNAELAEALGVTIPDGYEPIAEG